MHLLKAATGGMFSHRQQLYQQVDGVSMGNPLAPTIANFFLGHLENQLFDTKGNGSHPQRPAIYTRYVDDIFCIFRKDVNYEPFLDQLNE